MAVQKLQPAAISDTTESAHAAASDTMTAATEAVSGTYRSGIDAASRAGDQVSESFRQSKESLFETMESHPFLVGGVGLVIGAVIASALPVSHAENRLFGHSSDDLKNRARDMTSEGLEVAKTAAEDVYQESVSRAQEEGLSPEMVRQTVKSAGDKVKNVVQQAADALDEKREKAGSPAPSVVPREGGSSNDRDGVAGRGSDLLDPHVGAAFDVARRVARRDWHKAVRRPPYRRRGRIAGGRDPGGDWLEPAENQLARPEEDLGPASAGCRCSKGACLT
jgi:gas vesicle protein